MIYFKLYILSELLLTVYGKRAINSYSWEKLPKECGRSRYENNKVRIIDGEKAALGQFPWIARLGETDPIDHSIFFFCGGSLISRYYVITAAHCDDNIDIVRLGENYMNTDKDCNRFGLCAPPHQDIGIKRFVVTGSFNNKSFIDDIQLIELRSPAIFNDFVRPICLPRRPLDHRSLTYQHVTISGWGLTSNEAFTSSTYLKYIVAPVLDVKGCNLIYKYKLKRSQICIGYADGGRDTCIGDSGGPVTKTMRVDGQRRMYLLGLVSYGLTTCGKGPAVYTDVSYFIEWILSKIK